MFMSACLVRMQHVQCPILPYAVVHPGPSESRSLQHTGWGGYMRYTTTHTCCTTAYDITGHCSLVVLYCTLLYAHEVVP